MAFQGEQVLGLPEDRFDALADGGQVGVAAGFVLACRARYGDTELAGGLGEGSAGVASSW